VIVPGGFSYGDYLRVGAIARFSPLMESVIAFADQGGPVLGICNGFQVLCEAHLLPGRAAAEHVAALRLPPGRHRRRGRQRLDAERRHAVDPVKHTTGRYFAPDLDPTQVVFRYAAGQNPTAPQDDIAGVRNEAGNVVGLMPHPEHAVDARTGSADGLHLFEAVLHERVG